MIFPSYFLSPSSHTMSNITYLPYNTSLITPRQNVVSVSKLNSLLWERFSYFNYKNCITRWKRRFRKSKYVNIILLLLVILIWVFRFLFYVSFFSLIRRGEVFNAKNNFFKYYISERVDGVLFKQTLVFLAIYWVQILQFLFKVRILNGGILLLGYIVLNLN